MAIVALLAALAVPRYFGQLDKSKEVVLRSDLATMREAVDRFYGDVGRYPESLDELVRRRYLRALPVDPLTDSASTWIVQADPARGLYDVRSGAAGNDATGVPYAEW